MAKNTRLELTWIGKDERPRLEPRILIEDPALSHHASAKGACDSGDVDFRTIGPGLELPPAR
jgi:hypothetical protein